MRRVSKTASHSLTKPQWELLCDIVDGKIKSAWSGYKPRKTLEAIGLIRVYAPGWADTLIATDAGKELVRSVREAQCGK